MVTKRKFFETKLRDDKILTVVQFGLKVIKFISPLSYFFHEFLNF